MKRILLTTALLTACAQQPPPISEQERVCLRVEAYAESAALMALEGADADSINASAKRIGRHNPALAEHAYRMHQRALEQVTDPRAVSAFKIREGKLCRDQRLGLTETWSWAPEVGD